MSSNPTKTAKVTAANHKEATRLLPYGKTLQAYINMLLARQLKIEARKQEKRK